MSFYPRPTKVFEFVLILIVFNLILLTVFYHLEVFKTPNASIRRNPKGKSYLGKISSLFDWKIGFGHEVDPGLLEHLQAYDPALKTNYSASWGLTAKFERTKWKQAMSRFIIKRLNNKTDGYFIECGAFEGQFLSNTLFLERFYNWTGLLVEADPAVTRILKRRNRHAWVADVCLSTKPYPFKVNMTSTKGFYGHGYIDNDVIKNERKDKKMYSRKFEVECYPLHNILDAIGQKEVDYFSLDVEGVELDVLKTIPWDRIKIQLISVEIRDKNNFQIKEYLESVGYKKIHQIVLSSDYIHDHVYELTRSEGL